MSSQSAINAGLIGYGYWGPNLARNLENSTRFNLKYICDLERSRLQSASLIHKSTCLVEDSNELIESTEVDAIFIASPVRTHYTLAKKALKSGKHVFVEKPITESFQEALELVTLADFNNLTLMVDHTFIFTGAVQEINRLIKNNDLGSLLYYCSERVNLGIFQTDVNVLWDLAVHDLSILNYINPSQPKAVSACGMQHITNSPTNIAFLTLYYPSNFIAHINVNWLSPVKLRRCLIGGTKKMLVYDELNIDEKIKIYDKGVELKSTVLAKDEIYNAVVGYRTGDIAIPKLDPTEALRTELYHFADSIEAGSPPRSSGVEGARIVAILEAASESMRKRGVPVVVQSVDDSIS